ncbi:MULTISPECIES: hypothetical protein [Prauserella salsuginis group]|uniref:DUF308 domain-containing protein n=2 Tax=Prauserella salsuginis group TaxID=2893672 RepID=A0A839XMD4_9PSEU|nr:MULTISPECIES: hypothetical protein [Prauserella salsuginis group]MBB3665032.1 hypothetical protein [Prauserella sediminis]MCR3718503.1 hypothetical protein [Prauserella flava]MCR3733073.1 hypothetical protein [Prauserella salsuginis]
MSRPGSDGPENVDATFEEIVADLRAQGFDEHAFDPQGFDEPGGDHRDDRGGAAGDRGGALAERPGPGPADDRDDDRDDDGGPAGTAPGSRGDGWRDSPIAWDETMFGPAPGGDEDPDDHFVPPEPPPLPKPRKGAVVVLVLLVLGMLLLIAPSLVGLSGGVATPLGMLALAAGLALLLLRVRQGPPDGADPTNGAQV